MESSSGYRYSRSGYISSSNYRSTLGGTSSSASPSSYSNRTSTTTADFVLSRGAAGSSGRSGSNGPHLRSFTTIGSSPVNEHDGYSTAASSGYQVR